MDDACEACGKQGLVFVGGAWWCPEHLDLGFSRALRRYFGLDRSEQNDDDQHDQEDDDEPDHPTNIGDSDE